MTPNGDEHPGPGSSAVPTAAIVAFTVFAVMIAIVALYSMWVFWPMTEEQAANDVTQHISWFVWHRDVSRETLFFLTVAIAGGLGGMIHTIRSFAWYVGNRDLRWSWIPYNLLLPMIGALAATVFYLVLRAGLFSPSTSVQQASPFGFAAIAILAGLFSPQAFEKLRLIASDIFAKTPEGEDHVAPVNPEPALATAKGEQAADRKAGNGGADD